MNRTQTFLIACLVAVTAGAQNTTNSPNSMFGLGDISTGEAGKYVGMGGVGIALRSNDFLNSSNPAALTALDSLKFVYEVGVSAAQKKYSLTGNNSSSFVGNVSNIGIGFQAHRWWFIGIGITPLSSVGYAITLDETVEGTDGGTISSLFEGNGGLSKIYLSNAFRLPWNLSLGVNISYVSGKTEQSETQESATVKETSYKRAFYTDFGVQYKRKLSKKWDMNLGAVYGYNQRLHQTNTRTVTNTSNDETTETKTNPTSECMPLYYGLGVALSNHRWTFSGDYKFLQWSEMESDYTGVTYRDQNRMNVGMEYLSSEAYNKPIHYMLGVGMNNAYIMINNKKVMNYSVSAGVAIPVMNNNLLSVGVKYDRQHSSSRGVQREQSLSFYLNLTFSEWSPRTKIQ
jgi:hypothetical protein